MWLWWKITVNMVLISEQCLSRTTAEAPRSAPSLSVAGFDGWPSGSEMIGYYFTLHWINGKACNSVLVRPGRTRWRGSAEGFGTCFCLDNMISFHSWIEVSFFSTRLPHDRLNSWKQQQLCNQLVSILPDCFANNPIRNAYMPMGKMSQNIVCRKIERALNWCWMLK